MLLLLAWKNVWRNKKRSLIIIAAAAVGLWGGLFSFGIMEGMAVTMVDSAIERNLSHIQIHEKNYLEEKTIGYALAAPQECIGVLSKNQSIQSFTARTKIEGMVSSPTTALGVTITGIVPEEERTITSISASLKEGTYFDEKNSNTILIGNKLAEKLNVKYKSKVVLSYQSSDGRIIYGAFRISGIYETESSMYDLMNIFVRRSDLTHELGLEVIHEIGIRLKNNDSYDAVLAELQQQFPNLDVSGWKDLAPDLKITAESTGLMMNIFLGIILAGLLFGITNTMLMSVLDRVREIGMLMAVGMARRKIFFLIMVETIFLSITGGVIGMLTGAATVSYFGVRGVDLSLFADGLALYGIKSIILTSVDVTTYPLLTIMIIVTAVLAAIYPAMKAIRLRPASAIRTL